MLSLSEATFTPAYPLVYAAVGTAQDGVFYPVSTDCLPNFPLLLPVGTIKQPVLQITDAFGQTAFFQIE
jgi:hypothetical protein